MPYLVGYPTPQDYGAAGDGVTDDTSALNTALSTIFTTNGGGVLFFPPGSRYLVSGTISVPPFTFIQGSTDVTLNLGTLPTTLPRIIASGSWAPGASTGIVSFLSKTPGGWGITAQSSGMMGVAIDGSANASSNLNGIFFQGPVYDTHLEDVYVVSAPHNGIHAVTQSESGITATFPYHQRWTRVTTNLAGNTGFNLVNFTDSTFTNCLAFASVSNNYGLQNNSNCVFANCRAEWSSGGRGFDLTGSAGSVVFDSCTTDQNFNEGFRIHAATGQSTQGGGVIISGGKFHLDGNGGTNPNGIKITGSTVPVTITGINVESGLNGSNYPTNAFSIDTSSNVIVSGSILQGTTSAWVDGGGNSFIQRRGCFGMTGSPNTQTTAQLADIPNTNTPLPDDQSLLAWTYDVANTSSTTTPTGGVVYLNKIIIRQTTTITNVILSVAAAPSGLTSGQNFAGLYNSSGTLLSATADQTTPWGTTGQKTAALTAAQTVAPGFYYLAFVTNASTTTPGFSRATTLSASTLNVGTTTSNPRFATSGTAQTTLPSSITITSAATSAIAFWGAFS